jgi:hypothetical protein
MNDEIQHARLTGRQRRPRRSKHYSACYLDFGTMGVTVPAGAVGGWLNDRRKAVYERR